MEESKVAMMHRKTIKQCLDRSESLPPPTPEINKNQVQDKIKVILLSKLFVKKNNNNNNEIKNQVHSKIL